MARITVAERKRQEVEAYDRAVYAALAWPVEPCPQPYSKERMAEMVVGFGYARTDVIRAWTYNKHNREATYGGFGKGSHFVRGDGLSFHSQTAGGPWFATEAEARLALRWAVCQQFSEELHRLATPPTKD